MVAMVRAAAVGDFDFSGMFTAILRHQVRLGFPCRAHVGCIASDSGCGLDCDLPKPGK